MTQTTTDRERAREIEDEVRFLLDRIDEIEFPDDTELWRDWNGHVAPPIARLKTMLSTPSSPVSGEGERREMFPVSQDPRTQAQVAGILLAREAGRPPEPAVSGERIDPRWTTEEAMVFAMLGALHENVPETERPISWSDLSDDQAKRAKAAVRAVVALTRPPEGNARALREALVKAVGELENLAAMVEGEVPSLLEDHHSYETIHAAIKAGNEALALPVDDETKRLRDALAPFAEACNSLDDETKDRSEIWELPAAMEISAGDLRGAKAALASPKPPVEGTKP